MPRAPSKDLRNYELHPCHRITPSWADRYCTSLAWPDALPNLPTRTLPRLSTHRCSSARACLLADDPNTSLSDPYLRHSAAQDLNLYGPRYGRL
jgi:hypothetical protein